MSFCLFCSLHYKQKRHGKPGQHTVPDEQADEEKQEKEPEEQAQIEGPR